MYHNIYGYILIMALVTLAIRVLPLICIRGQIENLFIKSFLYYVPYVTLSVMTFPAIMDAVHIPAAGAAALLIGIVLAWKEKNLFQVSVVCCIVVFLLEGIL